jgi:LysR family malonate utilization transcriptional regulator
MTVAAPAPPATPAIPDELTFRKLTVFLAFMETGTLSLAADRLGTSAVSVHRALHSLEEGLRCSLFRMEGRHLQPTDAAHNLVAVARQVMAQMEEGVRTTRLVAGYGADRIRIGSLYSLTAKAVPAVVMGLQARQPALQSELVLGSNRVLRHKLRAADLDGVLMAVSGEGVEADLVVEPLFDDEVFFAAPAASAHAQRSTVDLRHCRHERFVALSDGFATSSGFAEAFQLAGFQPELAMTTGDIFSLMNLVKGGMGCTLLPGRVRGVLPSGVVMVPLADPFRIRQTIALHLLRSRERDPSLLALLAVCRSRKHELM